MKVDTESVPTLTINGMTFRPMYDASDYAYHTYVKVFFGEDDGKPMYDISVTNRTPKNGSVTISSEVVKEGDNLIITATPNDGYMVKSITANGAPLTPIEGGIYFIDKVTANLEIVVSFTLINPPTPDPACLDLSAVPSAHYTASWETVDGINNPSFEPTVSNGGTRKGWGDWPQDPGTTAWVMYEWDRPVTMNQFQIFWYDDKGDTARPATISFDYMDQLGNWIPIKMLSQYEDIIAIDKYNTINIEQVTGVAVRINMTIATGKAATGIYRWKVTGLTAPTPSEAAPTPSEAAPTPSEAAPTPSEAAPTPNVVVPTPNVAVPTPNVAVPTPGVATPTPSVVKIPESDSSAEATLFISKNNGVIDIAVQLNKDRLLKQLNGITTAGTKLEIPLITQELIKQYKDSGIKGFNITVTIPNEAQTINHAGKLNLNLPAELLKIIKDSGIDLNITVKDDTGKELYTWNFSSKNLPGTITSDTNLILFVGKIGENAAINNLLPNQPNGLVFYFGHEGVLPGQASVRTYVGHIISERNKGIYLYHYNPNTKKLETLPYSSKYIIDEQGYITVNLVHCSEYVVLTKPAGKDTITSLLKQIQVSPQKATLYMDGTKGSQAKIIITVPATLKLIASLNSQSLSSAVGAVTVSYKSSNKKVVTVDSNGNMKAVGAGKAVIYTTITLYSKKTIVIKTVITVKKS